jgi:ethanolamine utilization protein EutA (predicted chaperonin)
VKYYLPHIIHIKKQSFFKSALFYRPISKKMAQEEMERRAVNKIIQKLVGDYFDWYK